MGFWHTGYAEFHEHSGFERTDKPVFTPIRFNCDQCEKFFNDRENLRRHRFEEHPVRQPALLILGKPVGSIPIELMTPIDASDIFVEDTVTCLVNGQQIEIGSLGDTLAKMRREFARIELINKNARTLCFLDFRVADESHLVGVENAFLRLARERTLNLQSVSRFNDDCREFSTAMSYCNGISNYLYGVMAKERSIDSGLRHEEYIQRYMMSQQELSGFERPLTRSIRSLVAFHFNQFDDAAYLAPEGALQEASSAFSALLQGMPWHFEEAFEGNVDSSVEHLLTDQDTLQILKFTSLGLVELKFRTDELMSIVAKGSVGGFDHLKRALLACEALVAQDSADSRTKALKIARAFVGNADTTHWATSIILRLSEE